MDDLTIEIFSADTDDRERVYHYQRRFTGDPRTWLREYKPSDQERDLENLGDWQLWYRIE